MVECKREGCTTKFKKKRSNHECCGRECYRKWYYDNVEGEEEKTLPSYKCNNCGHQAKLDFDPVEEDDFIRFKNFKCPECNQKVHE